MPQPFPGDISKLLKFFRNLFAHSEVLTEMLENPDNWDESTYPNRKRKYDKIAAQKFDIFFQVVEQPEKFRDAVSAFLKEQGDGPIH
jgi:hypothetical protein